MEPNKNIENQFRNKLNLREIEPTKIAWDRLDAMLTTAEFKSPKNKMNWLLIAAVFIGILFAGMVLYQLNSIQANSKEEVVLLEKNDNKDNKNCNQISNQVAENTILNPSTVFQKPLTQNAIINQKSKSNLSQKENQVAQIIQNSVQENQNPNEVSVPKINVNPKTLLAAVELTNSNQNIIPESISVNATSLLSQVNGELSQEFRETKFQKLKRNVQNVKVAMESRNNK